VHELLIVDLDPTITIRVDFLEGLGERLDDDATADESIEGHARGRLSVSVPDSWTDTFYIVFSFQEVHKLRRQVVSKLLQCVGEFLSIDRATPVSIKVLENILPIFNVFP